MKTWFEKILVLVIIFGALAPLSNISAQDGSRTDNSATNAAKIVVSEQSAKTLDEVTEAGKNSGGDSCGILNIGQCFSDVILLLPGYVALTTLKIAQWFTHISGMMLNYVVYYTVVNMKANISDAQTLSDAWRTIRDVGNMGFIFILLYAAIRTIIGGGGDNQKLVARVVVVAILINFSLFFTRFIIDISNVLAITFYDAIAPGALDKTFTQGLSGSLMEPLRLQSIFDVSSGLTIFSGEKIFIIGVAGTIFSLIAAFVFFAISILLIIRFVVLVFVMILSPIAFLSFILPQMKGYATQWWNALSGQAFFAPIYFLLTWVVIVVSRSMLKGGSFANLAGTSTAGGGTGAPPLETIEMIVNFAIVISMLVFSLVTAKSWANKAGPGVAGATKWAMGVAGAASFGLASRAGRYTIGAGAERFADSDRYKQLERDSAKSGLTGMKARLKLATADKARTSSFDARSAGIGSLLGGVPVGSAIGKGGFEADRKNFREFFEKPGTEAFKKRQERARKAGTALDISNNLEEAENLREVAEIEEEARKTGVMTPAQAARIDELTNKNKIARIEADARASGVMTPDQAAEIDKLTKEEDERKASVDKFEMAIAKASAKEIEAIVDGNRELLESQDFANKLNTQQLEALNKSDKFSESEKDKLKNSRFKQINDAVAAGPAALDKIRPKIVSLKDAELEMLDPAHLENQEFVTRLTPPQVEAITKSSRFTATQQNKVKELRRKPLLDAIDTSDTDKVRAEIKKLNPKDIAGMSWIKTPDGEPLLTHPFVLEALSRKTLRRMAETLSPGDIQTIRDAVERLAKSPTTSRNIPKLREWLNTEVGQDEFS